MSLSEHIGKAVHYRFLRGAVAGPPFCLPPPSQIYPAAFQQCIQSKKVNLAPFIFSVAPKIRYFFCPRLSILTLGQEKGRQYLSPYHTLCKQLAWHRYKGSCRKYCVWSYKLYYVNFDKEHTRILVGNK